MYIAVVAARPGIDRFEVLSANINSILPGMGLRPGNTSITMGTLHAGPILNINPDYEIELFGIYDWVESNTGKLTHEFTDAIYLFHGEEFVDCDIGPTILHRMEFMKTFRSAYTRKPLDFMTDLALTLGNTFARHNDSIQLTRCEQSAISVVVSKDTHHFEHLVEEAHERFKSPVLNENSENKNIK